MNTNLTTSTPKKEYASGASLTKLPVWNGRDTKNATDLTRAIVANIRRRKAFKGGVDFINTVSTAVARQFPDRTQNNVNVAVRRAIASYFIY